MTASERFQLRLSPENLKLFREAAQAQNVTVSDLLVKSTLRVIGQIANATAPVKAPLVVHASPAVKKEKPKRDPYKGMTYEQIQEAESNGGNYTDENGDTVSVRYS